ncbi:MAG: hypothetical protein ABSG99_02825 [Sedimentisphaerales bacterium]
MQILGIHIISDEKFRRQIADELVTQNSQNNAFIANLLFNAELYRKIAEKALHRPVSLPEDIRPRLAEKMRENRLKQK